MYFSFFWQFFFIQGFDFFWEDFTLFGLDKNNVEQNLILQEKYCSDISDNLSSGRLAFEIFKHYGKEFLRKERFLKLSFHACIFKDRPYQFITLDLMRVLFGRNLIFYKIFNIFLLLFNITILFLILRRLSIPIAVAGVFLYITSPEIWLSTVYHSQLGLFAQGGTFASIFFFIKLIEKPRAFTSFFTVLFYYALILITSNSSALTNSDGRYTAIIFISFIFLFRRKEALLHLPFLGFIFLMQVPVLGYFKKFFYDPAFMPLDLTSHPGTHSSSIEALKVAAKNYRFPIRTSGHFIVLGLFISSLINIYLILKKKMRFALKDLGKGNIFYEIIFIFFMWLTATLYMTARVRGYHYDKSIAFQLFDLIYLVIPSIMLIYFYSNFIGNSLKDNYKKWFIRLVSLLIISQILLNAFLLNRFRGRWGNHLGSWQSAKKHIEKQSNNALVLAITTMCYTPFMYYDKNITVMNNEIHPTKNSFADLTYIKSKLEEGYEDVFVLRAYPMSFKGEEVEVKLVEDILMNGDTGDIYDSIKKFIGRPPTSRVHLFHFKLDK